LLCESAKTVFKMNSLILVLFVGATVALAEIHEENDPHRPRPSGVSPRPPRPSRPHPPGPVLVSLVFFVTI